MKNPRKCIESAIRSFEYFEKEHNIGCSGAISDLKLLLDHIPYNDFEILKKFMDADESYDLICEKVENGKRTETFSLKEESTQDMTAVEWLEQEIFRRYKFTFQQLNCGPLEEAIQQAIEMEKQQIIDAFEVGYENGACVNEGESIYHGSNYYNEIFKNK